MRKVIIVLFFLLLHLPAYPVGITGTVDGVIKGGVIVTLYSCSGMDNPASCSEVATAETSVDGIYTFTSLSSGTYKVTASKSDYIFSPFFMYFIVSTSEITSADFASLNSTTVGLTPTISVLPRTTVEVGEPVLFNASGTTYPADEANLKRAHFTWDYGDGYACQSGPVKVVSGSRSGYTPESNTPRYAIECKGQGNLHYYMKPGTYSVRMNVVIFDTYNTTKIGELSATYQGCWWINSRGCTENGVIASGSATTTITVTGTEPVTGFEVQHADFNNRTKQYVHILIPEDYRDGGSTEGKLTLSLIDTSEDPDVTTLLLDKKADLSAEEDYLLDHTTLTFGHNYVLQAQLLNLSDEQVVGGIWREKFTVPNSMPIVTIDQYNSISVNGILFFPLSTFLVNDDDMPTQVDSGNLNSVRLQGYNLSYSASTWSDYIGYADSSGIMATGPGLGDYLASTDASIYIRHRYGLNLKSMMNYVITNSQCTGDGLPSSCCKGVGTGTCNGIRNDDTMLFWTWLDEHNTGNWDINAYPSTVAAWSYITNYYDTDHIVYDNYEGSDWSDYGDTVRGGYPQYLDYKGNSWFLGGKKYIQQMLVWDTYPIKYQHSQIQWNNLNYGPYNLYLKTFDRAILNNSSSGGHNHQLVPILTSINPGADNDYKGYVLHTADQVYNEAWLNVIHGAKGINWFQYFKSGNIQWAKMAQFADKISIYKPYILAEGTYDVLANSNYKSGGRTITRTETNENLNRIDIMMRESGSNLFLFAARVTEPVQITGIINDTTDNVTINNGGTGYIASDSTNTYLTLIDGNSKARLKVISVDGSGGITSISLYDQGSGYTGSSTNIATTCQRGGVTCVSGAGATFNIGTVESTLYANGSNEPDTISAEFTISGLSGSTVIAKEDKDGNVSTLNIVAGVFSDTFEKNAVNIYHLSSGVSQVLAPWIR